MSAITRPKAVVHYPDDDGEPMSDNTVQFDWITLIKCNLEHQFAGDPAVFVAGNHLIYPVEGHAKLRHAPDAYVAFGRPKVDRGSYKVWEEDGIFPQVVFEVWSPSNDAQNMEDRRGFYEQYGAEEFYIVYPQFPSHAEGWMREAGRFVRIPEMDGWVSPRLVIRFAVGADALTLTGPGGRVFLTPAEIAAERDAAEERAEAERLRAERLAARLRELGVDPDAV